MPNDEITNTTDEGAATADEMAARLQAAGVTDEASLSAALQRDPQLRTDFEKAAVGDLLARFTQVDSPDAMHEFWRAVPTESEQPLIGMIESLIAREQADGNTSAAENLSARLADFRQLCEQAATARNRPPVLRALDEFASAPDDAAAREVFNQQRHLLQPYEAQQIIESNAQSATDLVRRQRLTSRASLLRQLRAAGSATSPLTQTPLSRPVPEPTHADASADRQARTITGSNVFQLPRA
jgi:hypothetical protein